MKTTKIKIKNLFGISETELDGQSVEITGTNGAGKRGKQNLDCITTIAKWMSQDNVPRKKTEVNDGGTHTNFRPSEW